MKQLAALVLPRDVYAVKQAIKDIGLYDKARGVEQLRDRRAVFLNTTVTNQMNSSSILEVLNRKFCGEIELIALPAKVVSCDSQTNDLQNRVKDFFELLNIKDVSLIKSVPKRYVIYYPMALFPAGSWCTFAAHLSECQQTSLFQSICSNLHVSHLAVNGLIEQGHEMRRPTGLVPLYGYFGPPERILKPTRSSFEEAFWVETVQNGIKQTWPPIHVMFSRGNITEKARILRLPDVKDSTIADMYAGIGYFTFSYVKAGAKVVYCWEINPWSVEAILRGAKLNGWSCRVIAHDEEYDSAYKEKIVVFHESNVFAESRLRVLSNIRHVNLGLLPTSKPGLLIASRLNLARVSHVHMHENVAANDRVSHGERLKHSVLKYRPMARIKIDSCTTVKTFAPGILHCVYDIEIQS